MDIEEADKILEAAAIKLGEHFDAVQILVSWNEQNRSFYNAVGAGNWYARQGMAHEFIKADDAQTNAVQLQRVMPPPPDDDGDAWKTEH